MQILEIMSDQSNVDKIRTKVLNIFLKIQNYNYNNNSIQFFIIYVPSQQLQGQLQTEHRVDTSNYIMDKHNIKSKTNYRQALEENTIMQTSKQTKKQ
jgi:hypothetical protein